MDIIVSVQYLHVCTCSCLVAKCWHRYLVVMGLNLVQSSSVVLVGYLLCASITSQGVTCICINQYALFSVSCLHMQDSECYTVLLDQIAPPEAGVDLSPLSVSIDSDTRILMMSVHSMSVCPSARLCVCTNAT